LPLSQNCALFSAPEQPKPISPRLSIAELRR
jgi:hypothetical protein